MELNKTEKPKTMVSLVPMIDVMLIMLVFFMVTSTYLNLDMVPIFERPKESVFNDNTAGDKNKNNTILIRLNSNGIPYFMGKPYEKAELAELIETKIAINPATSVLVFPSHHADTQSLVSLMDTVTLAGSSKLRIIRLDEK